MGNLCILGTTIISDKQSELLPSISDIKTQVTVRLV